MGQDSGRIWFLGRKMAASDSYRDSGDFPVGNMRLNCFWAIKGTCKEWTAKVLRERRRNCSPAALILISCRKQSFDHFEFWHLWFWKSWQTCLNQILRSSCPLPVSPLIAWTSTCLGYFDILGEGSTCKTLFGCPPPVILILQRIMTCSQPDLLVRDILYKRKLFIDC